MCNYQGFNRNFRILRLGIKDPRRIVLPPGAEAQLLHLCQQRALLRWLSGEGLAQHIAKRLQNAWR